MPSRYIVNDDRISGYNVTDITDGTSYQIRYNFTGSANATTATTWQFAPIDEQWEVEPDKAERFRRRLHQDDQFIGNQIIWNSRLNQLHQYREDNSWTTWTSSGLTCTTASGTDTAGTWWLTSDVGYWHNKEPTLKNRIIYQVTEVIPRAVFKKPLTPITRPVGNLIRKLKLNPTAEQHQRRLAERKSMKLLKGWLDPHEFKSLMERGELEIFAEDVVYIVKKDPGATVSRKKNGKQAEFCMIPTKMGWATGDILLSKILMLKANPEEFERVAIKRYEHPITA